MSIPYVKKENGIDTLFVNDEPFIALSGEVHNSSSSSLKYMDEHVWPTLQGLNMNSLVLPIAWETIEPEENHYDFSIVDGLIQQARENNMKLIFLWFGMWKNSTSMYVPKWMKEDPETYFLVKTVSGENIDTISPLCEIAVKKDAAAFRQLMRHIRETDEQENTVIMMQVENEVGVMKTDRDYCDAANKMFNSEIPGKLASALGLTGTWKEAFGRLAEESFMAYCLADAIEKITSAGQEEYPLPCYANCWLKQYPWLPGTYPSGGPVTDVHKIWKVAAPSLFTLAPDIYVPNVPDIMDQYSYDGNVLLVPEVRKDAVAASYCLYAVGKHNAVCFSPFGIEEMTLDPAEVSCPPMEVMISLDIDPSAFDITGSKDYLSAVYDLISEMKPLYYKYRGTGQLQAYVRHNRLDKGALLSFENYDLVVSYARQQDAKPPAAGLVYELEQNKFLLISMNSTFTFKPKFGENVSVGVLCLEEGTLKNGEWISDRILNGDEKMTIHSGDIVSCLLVELYKY